MSTERRAIDRSWRGSWCAIGLNRVQTEQLVHNGDRSSHCDVHSARWSVDANALRWQQGFRRGWSRC